MNRNISKKILLSLILALLCAVSSFAEDGTVDPSMEPTDPVETQAPADESKTDPAESESESESESTDPQTPPAETESGESGSAPAPAVHTYTLILELEDGDRTITQTSTESVCTLAWEADPVKTGYQFLGWARKGDNNVIVAPGKLEYTATTTDVSTLVPQWKAIDYTMTFDVSAYDGKCAPIDPITYQIDSTITFPLATLDHYQFKGWKVVQTVGSFEKDSMITALSLSGLYGDVTLTPYFEPVVYTLTLVYPDGSEKREDYTVEDLFALPSYEKTGYAFDGWRVTAAEAGSLAENTELYAPEQVAVLFGDATLNAQITPISYTITLLPNDGITTDTTLSYTVENVPAIADPERIGFTFLGWDTVWCEADSAWADAAAEDAVYYGDVKLLATWEENTVTIQYEVHEGKGGSVSVNWQTVTVLGGEVKEYESTFANIPVSTHYPSATPIAGPGYRFAGWYTVNASGGRVPVPDEWVDEFNVLYPEKDQNSGLYEDGYYLAVFEQVLGSLTIHAEGVEKEQSLIFDVMGIPDDGALDRIFLTVVIPAGETFVTIESLPVGVYSVTERSDWSWRYDEADAIRLTVISDEEAALLAKENGEEKTTSGGEENLPGEDDTHRTSEATVGDPGHVTFAMSKAVDLWLNDAAYCYVMPAEPVKEEESDEE